MTCSSLETFMHTFFVKILFSLCYFFDIPQNEILLNAAIPSPTLFPFSRIQIKPKTEVLPVKKRAEEHKETCKLCNYFNQLVQECRKLKPQICFKNNLVLFLFFLIIIGNRIQPVFVSCIFTLFDAFLSVYLIQINKSKLPFRGQYKVQYQFIFINFYETWLHVSTKIRHYELNSRCFRFQVIYLL